MTNESPQKEEQENAGCDLPGGRDLCTRDMTKLRVQRQPHLLLHTCTNRAGAAAQAWGWLIALAAESKTALAHAFAQQRLLRCVPHARQVKLLRHVHMS